MKTQNNDTFTGLTWNVKVRPCADLYRLIHWVHPNQLAYEGLYSKWMSRRPVGKILKKENILVDLKLLYKNYFGLLF